MTAPDTSYHQVDGELTIRSATMKDLPALLKLLGQMHGEEPADSATSELEEVLSNPIRTLLVAERKGELVGTLDLIVVPNLTRGGKPWAAIENVVVDAGQRRQGIGGSLLDSAVEIARSCGCYKLQLVSHQKRDAAHALYRHAHFDAPVRGYRRYLEP
jgi:GNAT superfamily N-acetyltransferase